MWPDSFQFILQLHDAEFLRAFIATGGLGVLLLIIFAETGLLFGFFLPGDSLLVTAGLLCAPLLATAPVFELKVLAPACFLVAVVGDQLNYYIGKKFGTFWLRRPESWLLKRKHFDQAQGFYSQHGAKSIILARFVPVLRTFVPFMAGTAQMSYRSFVRANVVGGFIWVFSLVGLGYFLGHTPLANKLHQIIIAVVFLSILPLLWGLGKKLLPKLIKGKVYD